MPLQLLHGLNCTPSRSAFPPNAAECGSSLGNASQPVERVYSPFETRSCWSVSSGGLRLGKAGPPDYVDLPSCRPRLEDAFRQDDDCDATRELKISAGAARRRPKGILPPATTWILYSPSMLPTLS